ncbi:MAG: phage baseplate assembly protein V [Ectothiorhodospiraceae bacterium]|nr:phage baseplate assembly protein V [Ectothiorhodospiraceae bacterium]
MSEASLERRVRELERRMVRLVQVGTVVDVDYPAQRVQVRIGERDSAWLRFTTRRAGEDRTWWPPTVGEQVLVFAPNGEAVAAVAGDSLYQQDFDAPSDDEGVRRTVYGNGTEVELDKNEDVLRVKHPGAVEVEAEGDVSITAGGTLTLQGETVRINE